MLVNGVLAYIKAFCQRVDIQSIKAIVFDCYDDDVGVRPAKDQLWNAYKEDFNRLKVEYNCRCGTASRSQANADIAVAFESQLVLLYINRVFLSIISTTMLACQLSPAHPNWNSKETTLCVQL